MQQKYVKTSEDKMGLPERPISLLCCDVKESLSTPSMEAADDKFPFPHLICILLYLTTHTLPTSQWQQVHSLGILKTLGYPCQRRSSSNKVCEWYEWLCSSTRAGNKKSATSLHWLGVGLRAGREKEITQCDRRQIYGGALVYYRSSFQRFVIPCSCKVASKRSKRCCMVV